MTTDNKCEACDGTGSEFSGVEYMGQREVVGCDECCGTGFADVSEGVESLRAGLTTTRQRLEEAEQNYQHWYTVSEGMASKLATTRQERNALELTLNIMRNESMQAARYSSEREGDLLAEIERLKGDANG